MGQLSCSVFLWGVGGTIYNYGTIDEASGIPQEFNTKQTLSHRFVSSHCPRKKKKEERKKDRAQRHKGHHFFGIKKSLAYWGGLKTWDQNLHPFQVEEREACSNLGILAANRETKKGSIGKGVGLSHPTNRCF